MRRASTRRGRVSWIVFSTSWQDLRPADRWIAEFEVLRACHPEFPSRAVELRTYWAMGTLLHRQPQHPFVPVWAARAEAILNVSDRDLSILLGGYLVIHHLWRGNSAKARDLIRRLEPWTQSPELPPLVSILWSCAVGLYTRCAAIWRDAWRSWKQDYP